LSSGAADGSGGTRILVSGVSETAGDSVPTQC
jgi:hypothetical protein